MGIEHGHMTIYGYTTCVRLTPRASVGAKVRVRVRVRVGLLSLCTFSMTLTPVSHML